MDLDTMGFALVAGLVAAVNPCGFAMLPAYLSLVVVGEDGVGLPPSVRHLRTG